MRGGEGLPRKGSPSEGLQEAGQESCFLPFTGGKGEEKGPVGGGSVGGVGAASPAEPVEGTAAEIRRDDGD